MVAVKCPSEFVRNRELVKIIGRLLSNRVAAEEVSSFNSKLRAIILRS